jgi:predicted DNA-binding protein
MAKIFSCIYLEIPQIERLDKLSAKTRVAKAEYIQEGIDLLLKKYKKQLGGEHKKGEGED